MTAVQRRDYKKATAYEDTPAQVKHREERNHLRAEEKTKLGHAPVGDVAHIRPLESSGPNTLANARVESVAKNRSWRKGQKKYHVPLDK
jgi:putative SOS response-associated peptidase YedK